MFPFRSGITIATAIFVRVMAMVWCASVVTGCKENLANPRTSADHSTDALGLYVHARSNGSVTQAFVSPINKYGIVQLGPTDKLFIAAAGGKEQPFVSYRGGHESIAQITTEAATFSIVFVRGSERFVSTVELPPPFMLEAHYGFYSQNQAVLIETRWTPSHAGSEMVLLAEGYPGRFEAPHQPETDAPFGTGTIVRDGFRRPNYVNHSRSSSDDIIVTATRTGGHVTLHPAFAKIPNGGTLEQIRTTIVALPPPEEPQVVVPVELAP